MNKSGITKGTGAKPTQILFSTQNQQSVSVLVSNTGISAGADGKKIVKAGTPLDGNIEARGTAFTKSAGTAPVGVLLHDVDVTAGNANGSILIWGFVNLDRIDATTQALITAGVKTALKGAVTFLKD